MCSVTWNGLCPKSPPTSVSCYHVSNRRNSKQFTIDCSNIFSVGAKLQWRTFMRTQKQMWNVFRHYISGADTIGHVTLPTFTNSWVRGERKYKNSKEETDQTVLTITKALTETINCTCRAKKWNGRIIPLLSNSFCRHCLNQLLSVKK